VLDLSCLHLAALEACVIPQAPTQYGYVLVTFNAMVSLAHVSPQSSSAPTCAPLKKNGLLERARTVPIRSRLGLVRAILVNSRLYFHSAIDLHRVGLPRMGSVINCTKVARLMCMVRCNGRFISVLQLNNNSQGAVAHTLQAGVSSHGHLPCRYDRFVGVTSHLIVDAPHPTGCCRLRHCNPTI
jgi:hypothetical protein